MSGWKKLFFLNKKRQRFLKPLSLSITKRQRFVVAVFILSLGLFISNTFLPKSSLIIAFALGIFADVLFLLATYKDVKENFSAQLFILPFVYSSSFELFHLLIPSRFLTRIAVAAFYAVGLYSLFLSQNIFLVGSIRTIALLAGARIVSTIIALVSYFFLTNVIYSLHLPIFFTSPLLFLVSFILITHSVWTITLEKSLRKHIVWILILSLALFEISLILWFWPTTPTVIAIFLTGFFYTIVGLSQVWHDKRLFRGVMWEYLWVSAIVFFVLVLFTSWKG